MEEYEEYNDFKPADFVREAFDTILRSDVIKKGIAFYIS